MQRVRRLASITVIALVGVAALSACRSQPGVAAYVGDEQYTEEQVTSLIDDMADQLGEQADQQGAPPLPTRQQVVSALVLADVCAQLDAPSGAQPVSPEQLGLPPASEYGQTASQAWTCIVGLQAGGQVQPTREELFDLVEKGRAAGVIPDEVTDEEAAGQLDGEQLRSSLAARDALADAVAEQDVTVNPRYRPLEFPVLSFQAPQGNVIAVGIPLGDGDSGTVSERQ
ncbi:MULTISPECIES: hypothetical protein [unclassified Solwaraspora]|uniref:hypothetical protein n=1 Tax=unclassified Solwaraspora TaxID=2627926 RepID=UPI00248C52F2|nr:MULTISPECIES: hypothetical protein [unclassified Solwaraspora]WBB96231.1 hypothetical protein O7553_23290 [Solwaraspora sp. WMMA2059]WBC19866.1 hypothetical protein O7543_24090 [Solwaraspora sp. WMMA2080]WJK32542.1 hypothetical protein O7610_17435 [Solwaraspora sp. WMMA2065]